MGAYRDEQKPYFEDISIYNYTFQYIYHIITRIHIYSFTDLGECLGSMGIMDYRLSFRYLFMLMNTFLSRSFKKKKHHLAWPLYYQTDFTFLEFEDSYVICLINMGMF